MSGWDCRNKWVFNFRRNTSKDGAYVMSSCRTRGQQQQMNDHQQLQAATEGWPVQRRLTTGDGVFLMWCLKRGAADQTDTEVQCREYLGRQINDGRLANCYLSGLLHSNLTPIYSLPIFCRLSSLAFGRAIRQKLLFGFCLISCRL